jgi:hypothetical protein
MPQFQPENPMTDVTLLALITHDVVPRKLFKKIKPYLEELATDLEEIKTVKDFEDRKRYLATQSAYLREYVGEYGADDDALNVEKLRAFAIGRWPEGKKIFDFELAGRAESLARLAESKARA